MNLYETTSLRNLQPDSLQRSFLMIQSIIKTFFTVLSITVHNTKGQVSTTHALHPASLDHFYSSSISTRALHSNNTENCNVLRKRQAGDYSPNMPQFVTERVEEKYIQCRICSSCYNGWPIFAETLYILYELCCAQSTLVGTPHTQSHHPPLSNFNQLKHTQTVIMIIFSSFLGKKPFALVSVWGGYRLFVYQLFTEVTMT